MGKFFLILILGGAVIGELTPPPEPPLVIDASTR
jgi:hypothetical protein